MRRLLRDCVAAEIGVHEIFQEFGGKYSVDSIRMKMSRLELVDRSESLCTTTSTTTTSLSAAPVSRLRNRWFVRKISQVES